MCACTCSGFACRLLGAHQLADDQAERHAALGLRLEQPADRPASSRASCRAPRRSAARPLARAARSPSSTSDFGTSSWRRVEQRLHHRCLVARLDALADLALEVLRARRRACCPRSPSAMPSDLANSASRSRQLRRLDLACSVTRELGFLAGHVLARGSRPGNVSGKVFDSPAFMPRTAASNSASIRPSPMMNGKSSALPPANGSPSIVPAKSIVTRSPSAAGARGRARSVTRCLRRISSVLSIAASSTVSVGRSIFAPRQRRRAAPRDRPRRWR